VSCSSPSSIMSLGNALLIAYHTHTHTHTHMCKFLRHSFTRYKPKLSGLATCSANWIKCSCALQGTDKLIYCSKCDNCHS
jgi:hypothetical protein